MILSDLFPHLNTDVSVSAAEVSAICRDSRDVSQGAVFFVIEGKNFDVFGILKEIESHVLLFVASSAHRERMEELDLATPVLYTDDLEGEFRHAVDSFYDLDWSRFGFIGITGTNGKTTTAHLLYQMIRRCRIPASLVGTIQYYIDEKPVPAPYTTPDYLLLRRMLRSLQTDDIRYVVMEVSSHAVTQGRVRGVPFRRCIFTNLSHDHLDYHKDMERYFQAKASFFSMNTQALAILNVDDHYGRRLSHGCGVKQITYAIDNCADFTARAIRISPAGTEFTLTEFGTKTYPVRTPLIGRHNVSNTLAALATLYSYGFEMSACIESLARVQLPCGRLERVVEGVYVDYAHTPDALEKAIGTLREAGYKKIICVFGCGGDRDRDKRPAMGRIACEGADVVIITSDNPRSEDPAAIITEIEPGCVPRKYSVDIDRRRAIQEAMSLRFQEKDCAVLVAGKGHEQYQIIGTKKIPFSDRDVILSCAGEKE